MKLRKLILKGAILASSLAFVATIGLARPASAACVQYDPNSSIDHPVFNNFCNVPNGIGNEPDFVRVRQNLTGDNKDNQNNPLYTDTLNAACKTGDQFDVWTYVHNNAASGFNKDGSGSAVAHDVTLAMNAPLSEKNQNFTFSSIISASNAGTVQDTAKLNCSENVELNLVPSTVHIYSQQFSWKDLPNSAVNGTTKLGSPNFGSGDVWGCWEYRVVVVYTVKVEKKVPPVTPPVTPPKPPVTPPTTPPTTLLNTGPGDMLGIFGVTTAAGAFLHRKWSLRRAK